MISGKDGAAAAAELLNKPAKSENPHLRPSPKDQQALVYPMSSGPPGRWLKLCNSTLAKSDGHLNYTPDPARIYTTSSDNTRQKARTGPVLGLKRFQRPRVTIELRHRIRKNRFEFRKPQSRPSPHPQYGPLRSLIKKGNWDITKSNRNMTTYRTIQNLH